MNKCILDIYSKYEFLNDIKICTFWDLKCILFGGGEPQTALEHIWKGYSDATDVLECVDDLGKGEEEMLPRKQ